MFSLDRLRIGLRVAQSVAILTATPQVALAQSSETRFSMGGSSIWVFANFSYAAMRAQGNGSGWRIACFVFGFPGTLLSMAVVEEGSERMYGFDLPKKRP